MTKPAKKYLVCNPDTRTESLVDAEKFDGMLAKLIKSPPIPQASVKVRKATSTASER